MDLGARLRLAMKRRSLSQTALADRLGVPQSYVAKILSGERSGQKHMPAIAEALAIPLAWLTIGVDPPDWVPVLASPQAEPRQLPEADDRGLDIPCVGTVAAADVVHHYGIHGESEHHDYVRMRARWIAVRVTGDSGHPIVWPGQSVLVDPELTPRVGRIVVLQGPAGEALVKRFAGETPDHIFLASLNAGIDSMVIEKNGEPWRVFVVVGVIFTDSVAR